VAKLLLLEQGRQKRHVAGIGRERDDPIARVSIVMAVGGEAELVDATARSRVDLPHASESLTAELAAHDTRIACGTGGRGRHTRAPFPAAAAGTPMPSESTAIAIIATSIFGRCISETSFVAGRCCRITPRVSRASLSSHFLRSFAALSARCRRGDAMLAVPPTRHDGRHRPWTGPRASTDPWPPDGMAAPSAAIGAEQRTIQDDTKGPPYRRRG